MRLNSIQFDAPLAAYLFILVVPLIGFFWFLWMQRQHMYSLLGNSKILASILLPSTAMSFWNKALAFCLAWVFGVLALMQPKGNPHYPEGFIPREPLPEEKNLLRKVLHEMILMVDASDSMQVADTRTSQSRFDYAKDIADEIIRRMQGDNVTLYAFTWDPTLLSPSTTDYLFARLMLNEMKINEGDIPGTNIHNALEKVHETSLSQFSPKRRTVILISDGGDTNIEGLTGESKTKAIDKLTSIIEDSFKYNYRVFTIGMGSEKGALIPGKQVVSALQKDLLQKISTIGRGQFYFANQMSPLEITDQLFQYLNRFDKTFAPVHLEHDTVVEEARESLIYDLYFQVFLGLAILSLVYGMFFPQIIRKEEKDEVLATT